MKKRFVLRFFGLLMSLALMTGLGLTACAPEATPTPTPIRTPTRIPTSTPKRKATPTPKRKSVPTPTLTSRLSVPRVINEILDSVDATFGGESDLLSEAYGEMREELEEYLSEDPENLWVRLNLAYVYQTSFQYREALEHYLKASEQVPILADPLIGLGRLYYDLAIIDMISRGLTSSSPSGLTVFHPDERAKEVLRLAKEKLLASKKLPRLERADKSGAKVYISPPGTEDEFLMMIEQHLREH